MGEASFDELKELAADGYGYLVVDDGHPAIAGLLIAAASGEISSLLGGLGVDGWEDASMDPDFLDPAWEAMADLLIGIQALASMLGIDLAAATRRRVDGLRHRGASAGESS